MTVDSNTVALLNAYHHVKRTGDAIRKAGKMFDRRMLSNSDTLTLNVGPQTMFSRAEEAQLADYCETDQNIS